MKAIYPCIWVDQQAQEAAEFYSSVFPDSKIEESNPMLSRWSCRGELFMCLNGGPMFQPNPSISFYSAFTPEEIQGIWDKMLPEGEVMMPLDTYPWSPKYGWIKDKYGVSWQLDGNPAQGKIATFAPSLMFAGSLFGRAEEAIQLYTDIFPNSSILFISRYGDEMGEQAGKINHAQFLLNGRLFTAMESNMEHKFTFTEGMSLVIPCEDQGEIDHFWAKLTEGGQESQCGWLKDKFGVSWQVVPEILGKLVMDPEKGQRVVAAFMKMKKFDIEALENV